MRQAQRWRDPTWLALASYSVLVLYASLYPFKFTAHKDQIAVWEFLRHIGPRPAPADVAVNFLAYIPLGFLIARMFRRHPWRGVAVAAVGCLLLSFSVETAQRFLVYRSSEISDIISNTLGATFGAWLWLLVRHGGLLGGALWRGIDRLSGSNAARLAAIGAASAWGVAQAIPMRSGIVLANVRAWHSTLRQAVHAAQWSPRGGIGYALTAAAVILVARYGMRLRSTRWWLLLLIVCVVPGKLIVNGAATPADWMLATLVGALLALMAPLPDRPTIAAMVALSFLAMELTPGAGGGQNVFNFVPFEGEITLRVNGIRVMLEQVWPFMAMASLIAFRPRIARQPGLMWGGANAVGCFVFILEWAQRLVPGRYGDITTVLIAVVAWIGTWMFVAWTYETERAGAGRAAHFQKKQMWAT